MREMKDSGIEWIGEISSKAKVYTLKFDTYMKGRIGWQGLKSKDFVEKGPYCVTSTDFEDGKVNWNTCYHVSLDRYNMDPFIQIKPGDLLISKDGTIGKLALVDSLPDKACLNSHLLIIRPLNNKYLVKYLYFVLQSNIFTSYYSLVGSGTTMQSLSQEKLGQFKFPMWSITDQQAIADYLDAKCADIDGVSKDIEEQIETLKEYKKSVITQAVTKGLDLHAKIKDSKVPWIGKISQKAKVYTLKFDTYMKGRIGWQGLKSKDFIEEGPYCVTSTDFENGRINWNKCYHVSLGRYNMDPFIQIKKWDLLISKDGTIGKLALVDNLPDKACLNSHLLIIRPLNNKYLVKYLYFVLQSNVFTAYYNLVGSGTTMQSLSQEKLGKFKFPIWSLSDQQSIVKYLDMKCTDIDAALSKKEKQLDVLKEYKKSLVYEYVTGKKEVPTSWQKKN